MHKVEIYPTIIENPNERKEHDVFTYLKLIETIKGMHKISIPDEFYTSDIVKFIWGKSNQNSNMQSLIDYFTEVILKMRKTDKTYESIFGCLNLEHPNHSEAITGMHGNKYIEKKELFIEKYDDIYTVELFYLSLINDFSEFEILAKQIFRGLAFLDNSFKDVVSLGDEQTTKRELLRHLDVLNRYAMQVYEESHHDAGIAMSKLNSSHGINCTGVGSNQKSSEFRLDDTYLEKRVNVRCNAHTKLFDARNNYRIYFSWENKIIEKGKIIIGSIGGHIDA